MKNLYFEDIKEGMEAPPLTKAIGMLEIVRFGGLIEAFGLLHIDKDYARQVLGMPDVNIHGPHKAAMLSTMLTSWCGETGALKKLACQYRGMDYCGDTLSVCAKVTRKYLDKGEPLVECEVWVENQRGEKNTRGTALLSFPLAQLPGKAPQPRNIP